MSRDVEVKNATAVMGKHYKNEQNFKPDRMNREEIDRNELRHVIVEKKRMDKLNTEMEDSLNNLNKKRGGARPNSGPKKGPKYAKTVAKEQAREMVRDIIRRDWNH